MEKMEEQMQKDQERMKIEAYVLICANVVS